MNVYVLIKLHIVTQSDPATYSILCVCVFSLIFFSPDDREMNHYKSKQSPLHRLEGFLLCQGLSGVMSKEEGLDAFRLFLTTRSHLVRPFPFKRGASSAMSDRRCYP